VDEDDRRAVAATADVEPRAPDGDPAALDPANLPPHDRATELREFERPRRRYEFVAESTGYAFDRR
jgi:hypothetical protein